MWMLFEAGLFCGSLVKRRDEKEAEQEQQDSEDPPPVPQA
jgi:sec-independent protein translocase protein TatC